MIGKGQGERRLQELAQHRHFAVDRLRRTSFIGSLVLVHRHVVKRESLQLDVAKNRDQPAAVLLPVLQRRPSRDLTLPRVRAIIQEVLTAHFFITRPHYLHRMLKLQQVSLRI